MSKYQNWFAEQGKQSRVPIALIDAIEAFIVGGDTSNRQSIIALAQSRGTWRVSNLKNCLPKPTEYSEEDRRAASIFLDLESSSLGYKLKIQIHDDPEADLITPIYEIASEIWSHSEFLEWVDDNLAAYLGSHVASMDPKEFKQDCVHRFILNQSDRQLEEAVEFVRNGASDRGSTWKGHELANLPWIFFLFDRERLKSLIQIWLPDKKSTLSPTIATAFTRSGFPELVERIGQMNEHTEPGAKLAIARELHDVDPKTYETMFYEAGVACLQDPDFANPGNCEALLAGFGEKALDPMIQYIENRAENDWGLSRTISDTWERLGKKSAPFLLAVFTLEDCHTSWHLALEKLIETGSDKYDQAIEDQIRQLMGCSESHCATTAVALASKWHPERFKDDLWKALGHRAKGVRETAARSLSLIGEAVLEKAADTLVARKAATRDATVTLLTLLDSSKAGEMLEARLDEEPAEDVRDHILLSLEKVWKEQGKELGLDYVEERIAKFVDKGGADPPGWLKLADLPPLQFQNGKAVSEDALRYLIYRQSRAKEIVPDIEIKPLLAQIDRSKSGEFAEAILKAYLSSPQDAKDRWALTLAGLLGDNRTIPLFMKAIREWPTASRHKLAEYAAQALALVGTDAALMAVCSLTIKYRSKYKNIGKAAAESFREAAFAQGITPEELGDRVVPRLGFEEGETSRMLEGGDRKIRQSIGQNLKFAFLDLDKNKPIKTLPAAIPEDLRRQVKEDAATLREVVKAQNLRLENLLVQQYEWPVDRWRQLFLEHPVLKPYGASLLWNCGDQVFRALEDSTLTDAEDETVELPKKGTVKLVHPLNLSEDQRQAWVEHFADYEVTPPFLQLERPVVYPDESEKGDKFVTGTDQTELGAMTFRGRAEKLGWVRGSVCDAGGITAYYKPFPGAGVDAFVFTEEMWVGMGVEDQMTMGQAFFVKHDSVSIGSYVYDEPSNDEDERLIAFGEVPPLVYSEVISELGRIAGKDLTNPEGDGEPGES